jgi:signal transduction histidine kinase
MTAETSSTLTAKRAPFVWRNFLPRGHTLPAATWDRRHRAILLLQTVQLIGLSWFGIFMAVDPTHLLLEMAILGGLLVLAMVHWLGKRVRALVSSFGLVSCSALLTHFSGGYIEAHFHFFVMLGIIVLYEDWIPFLLSIAYVAVHHGTVGTIDPASVYNHPAAIANPWLWAGIHALFILWLSAALILYWRTSEQLRAQTEVVLQSSASGILGVSRSGVVTFANPAAQSLGVVGDGGLVGRHVAEILPTPRILEALARRESEETRGVWATHRAGGGHAAFEWALRHAPNGGASVEHVVSLNDVTEREAAEATLREFAHELETRVEQRTRSLAEAVREVESFNYSVSHDLRSPLRVIRGFTELLLETQKDRLDETGRSQLALVHDASRRMNASIEALLELSRVGRTELHREYVNFSDLCRDMVEELRTLEPQRAVEVDIRDSIILRADPDLARIVVRNLLSNAWKFTRNTKSARISIEKEQRGGQEWLVVRDNGVGFDPQDAPKLFRAFSRLHGQQQYEGTGIGLATVARIINRHGGQVTAEAMPDAGATFRLTFGDPGSPPATGPSSEPRVEIVSVKPSRR